MGLRVGKCSGRGINLNISFCIWFKDYGEQSIGHNRNDEDTAESADKERPTQNVRKKSDQNLKHSARPPGLALIIPQKTN